MGAMTTCTGSINENLSSKELKFTLMKNPNSSIRGKNKIKHKSRSNSQIISIIKEEKYNNDFGIFKFEESKNHIPKKITKKNYIKNNKEIKSYNNNNNIIYNYKDKIKGYNSGLKQIDKIEDDCDIIECGDDEFECDKNILDLMKNVDITNNKRINYFNENNNKNKIKNDMSKENSSIRKEKENASNNELLNDSYINKDLNMELSISKNKINGSEVQSSTIFENLINNDQSIEKGIDTDNIENVDNKNNLNYVNDIEKINLDCIQINCYENTNNYNKKNNSNNNSNNNNNNNLCKIEESQHTFLARKQPEKKDIKETEDINNNKKKEEIKIYNDENNIMNKNKKNNDFQICKIDDNINININNNLNNINNINNISSINNNSELNNNNYIDVSSNTTYFLSVEKSHRRPIANIIDKNILSLKKNNYENNNNITCDKEINNNIRHSAGINKYKWKLLPKNKCSNQICKSFINSQSLSINEENLKNSQLMTIGKDYKNFNNISEINQKIEINNDKACQENNNLVFTELKKQKEEQDKKIRCLQDKIKGLYKIIKEEKTKEIKNDEKISRLEECLATAKNNSKNEKKLKMYKNENIQFKKALNDIKNMESIKDYKIKKLEEQLENIKKNNKINKNLLVKKNKQIQNLLASKSKQDELIKKYGLLNDINFNNNSTKGMKNINYFNDIENITNTLLDNRTSFSVCMRRSDSTGTLHNKNLNKSITLKNNLNQSNPFKNKSSNKKNNITYKPNKRKKINKKNITDIFNMDQENFNKEKENNIKIDKNINRNSYRNSNTNRKTNTHNNINNKNLNINSIISNKISNDKNINYNNYCNSLCNKSKNKYSNKISLNRIKMYKFNKCQNLPTNITNQITNKSNVKIKESLNLNSNRKSSSKKNFSFKKSKKKLTKDNELDLKEMYLNAGKVQKDIKENNKEKNDLYLNINNNNKNDNKIYQYNNIFYRNNKNKNNSSNSNNNTTITNNITNLSMSPIILSGFHNFENLSMDEKLNLSENINNNINSFNPYLKSISNEDVEKEKNENNKIYKKLWNEGFLRYEEMCKNNICNNKKLENSDNLNNENFWKLNFGMANELIEININKNEFMFDVKNKFLNDFFEKKMYGNNEKKYISDNILFLNKEGIIDIQKKVNENNLNNNEIIIPVLKDVT